MAVIETRTPTLPDHLLIDGQLTHGAGEPLVVVNPATEEPLGTINAATPAQADDAVRAARRAFDEGPWPHVSPAERSQALHRFDLAKRKDTIGRLPYSFPRCRNHRGKSRLAVAGNDTSIGWLRAMHCANASIDEATGFVANWSTRNDST